MDRRSFIIGAVAFAGCSSANQETATETQPQSRSVETGKFRVSVSVPNEIEIQTQATVRLTIWNVGDNTAIYHDYLVIRNQGSPITDEQLDIEIDPSESVTREYSFQPEYIGTVRVDLSTAGVEKEFQTHAPRLGFGDPFETAQGNEIVVDELLPASSYEHDSDIYSGNVTETPPTDHRFIFLRVKCTNVSPNVQSLPFYEEFILRTKRQQFDPMALMQDIEFTGQFASEELYRSSEVHPDISKSGLVLFHVPRDIQTDNLIAGWSDSSYAAPDQAAYWEQ